MVFYQVTAIAVDTTNWSNLKLLHKGNTPWIYALSFEARTNFKDSGDNQYLMSPSIGYTLSDRQDVWLGYDLFLTNKISIDEQRIWQQDQYAFVKNNKQTLTLRSRFEQRFSTDDDGVALRVRERLTWVLNNFFAKKYSPEVYEEVFFNVNNPDWVSSKTLSQNRLFMGVSTPLNKKTALLVGYLNQVDYNPDEATHQNIIYISLSCDV